jgi:hypothetical protein
VPLKCCSISILRFHKELLPRLREQSQNDEMSSI